MLWNDTQIATWRFPRDQIPQDIQDGEPNPDSWGTPVSLWTSDSCDIASSFSDLNRTSPPPRSLFSNLGSVIFGTLQSSSTSPSVVIGLAQTSTTVTMEELAPMPLRTMPTTNVRYPLQSFFFFWPTAYDHSRYSCSDKSQLYLRLPTGHLLNVERLNIGCIGDLMRAYRVPTIHNALFHHTISFIYSFHLISTCKTASQEEHTPHTLYTRVP